ncbi:MAG: signal peptidase II [Syntrophobacterales bacterium]|jgi:signal peptidase II|nr:signal peptidase II [Syntrophobacterales bacterium]
MRRYSIFLIIPLIFALDRWTKWLVTENLRYGESVDIAPYFAVVHWRNLGGAFGFLSQHHLGKYVFMVLPLVVAVALGYALIAYRWPTLKTFALTCVLAGALGNIYDRVTVGYVIDFLLFYYKNLQWPAFNVADTSISTGIGLWLLAEFLVTLGKRKAVSGTSYKRQRREGG